MGDKIVYISMHGTTHGDTFAVSEAICGLFESGEIKPDVFILCHKALVYGDYYEVHDNPVIIRAGSIATFCIDRFGSWKKVMLDD